MTIDILTDARASRPLKRLGAGRVEVEVTRAGSGVHVDGRSSFQLLGRVARNGPGSAWPIGQLLAFETVTKHDSGGIVDVDAERVLAVPDDVPDDIALMMPLLWPVLYASLTSLRVKAGDAVLVHHGDTLFGTVAIQFARTLTNTVMTVCQDRAGIRNALHAGACEAACYPDDWSMLLREHGGVDVVLDPESGRNLSRSLHCARRGARLGALDLDGRRERVSIVLPEIWHKQASVTALDWSPTREWQLASTAREPFLNLHRSGAFSRWRDRTATARHFLTQFPGFL